ncbi:MAG: DUF2808 domain-containing protein [Spirulinaceae cyanobacterium SM2_1_0]|nr:DUF2808 domain-containing protein [Spirulinaceae cyanobacterium SM2_1_0]
MVLSKHWARKMLLGVLAAGSCGLALLPVASLAQRNPGLTIFSGIRDRSDILSYYLDFGGRPNIRDRYRLRIPANKVELGVSQIAINYPDYYRGEFYTDHIEVHAGGETIPIQEVVLDEERQILQIYLGLSEEKLAALDEDAPIPPPIEAQTPIEIELPARNPTWGGTYYFHARLLSPGDVPLPRYVGTWILTIGQ